MTAIGNESTSIEDDSEADLIQRSENEEEGENNEEDNGSEPEIVVWSPGDAGLDHEMGYIVGNDAHTSGDQGLEETDCLGGNSSCLNISHSHITIQDNAEAPDEPNTADVTANQGEQEARRRDTSLEQPTPPNLHPDNGSTLSIEEQFLQTLRDGPTMLLELEELKAVGEAAEENIQKFKDKISANKEQLLQVLQSAPSENFISEMAPLYSDIVIQDGKRKMEEDNKIDTDRKKAKLVAQFKATSNQFVAQLRTNVQRHEAASESTPQ
ncbi:hypothetical protein ACHAPX_007931 [Trichoderma viride]